MSNENNENVISATSTGEVKKALEGRWMKSATFTNIDSEEFEGMWDGTPYVVEAGETQNFPLPLTEHLAAHLAGKVISKEGKIPSDNIPYYNELIAKILGKKIVDYSGYSAKELQEMATKKGINLNNENGKPKKKEDLISELSKNA